MQKLKTNNAYVVRKVLPYLQQITPIKRKTSVWQTLVKRCKHLKSVPKTMRKHNGAKTVAIATADVLKLELGVCGQLICESFESCEKCAQNVWGGTNVQKHQFLTIFGG